MGLFDKLKNMFTEEEEIDEPIKKEVIQVEIPSAMTKKEEVVEQKQEEKIVKPQKQEEKFIFPVYFDDKDFSDLDRKNKEEKKYRDERKYEPKYEPKYESKKVFEEHRYYEEKKTTPKPITESYKGKVVEEKKVFKPSPIISPVYGILDKNYTKEDITTKKPKEETKKVDDIDIIRNKAYGTLEDELVDSLNYETIDNVHTNDMEEYHKKMEDVDFTEILENDNLEENINDNVDTNLDELETKLSRVSKKEVKVEEEIKPKYSRSARKKVQTQELEPTEVSEDDLFDMIDTMYEEGK